jgi:hypothetical protein
MKKNTTVMAPKTDIQVDLTLHNVSVTLLEQFAAHIVVPYFKGNLNAAVQDLLRKALAEQDFVLSHISCIRDSLEDDHIGEIF